MALGDVYRYILNYRVQDEPCTSRCFFEITSATGLLPDAVAAVIGNALDGRFVSSLLPATSEDLRLVNSITNRIHPAFGVTETAYFAATAVGAIAEDATAQLAAAICSFRSDLASKSGRGRWFQSGIPESDTQSGTFFEAARANIESVFQSIFAQITPIGTGSADHIVWSKLLSSGQQVKDYLVRPSLGTQRRRRPRNVGGFPPAP